MSKKNEQIMCDECFALIEDCDCFPVEEMEEESIVVHEPHKSKNKKVKEIWIDVPSPYKAYKEGV